MEPMIGFRGCGATAAVLVAALAVSCGGGGSSGGMMSPPPPPLEPTLASIQANVFTPSCALSGCHAGSAPQQGQNLSSGLAFSNIVNVPSTEQPAFMRVKPGDPDSSYLYMKITGDPRISGVQMPKTGGPLSAAKIAAIHDWIANGAPAGTSSGGGGGGGNGGYP
jgi:hypothetical protein